MNRSISVMTKRLCSILGDNIVSIYLYGSVALGDFKPGWSDIDILCLTERTISDSEANQLVDLRQILSNEDESNPYYRIFEGTIVSIDDFKKNQYKKVVYWGTSGQKITDFYSFDVFSLYEIIKYGQLIWGEDIRHELVLPSYEALRCGVQQHYQAIRKYARKTGESIHSCGWLLDIARCIYTLRYHDVISKTEAGAWALKENLCPEEACMLRTLQIRNNPLKYKEKGDTKKWLSSLGPSIQLFADILEKELSR